MNRAPGINTLDFSCMVVRLQTLTSGQFDVGYHEVEFKPAFVAVFDPQAVVLIEIQPYKQAGFKTVHQRLLLGLVYVAFFKTQTA